ncbi:MAG: hypothetical protein ACRDD7_15075 [Peptostreptococcaceae bacterium]
MYKDFLEDIDNYIKLAKISEEEIPYQVNNIIDYVTGEIGLARFKQFSNEMVKYRGCKIFGESRSIRNTIYLYNLYNEYLDAVDFKELNELSSDRPFDLTEVTYVIPVLICMGSKFNNKFKELGNIVLYKSIIDITKEYSDELYDELKIDEYKKE